MDPLTEHQRRCAAPERRFARVAALAAGPGYRAALWSLSIAFFGFKDDVVIRIRQHGTGSRVDVRSLSRIGGSDVGANAQRIRSFLGKLGAS